MTTLELILAGWALASCVTFLGAFRVFRDRYLADVILLAIFWPIAPVVLVCIFEREIEHFLTKERQWFWQKGGE